MVIRTALLLLAASTACAAQTWESEIASTGSDGRLQYTADSEGNRIPDFSRAGYRGGGTPLPELPVMRTVAPVDGDDTASIQAAIDEVAALAPDADGHRGAVRLEPGTYQVNGMLRVEADGIVLRGAGDGDDPSANTILVRSDPGQDPVINLGREAFSFNSAMIRQVQGRASSLVADDLVPVGAYSFRVRNPERMRPGLDVVVHHPATSEWLAAIGNGGTASDPPWQVGQHPISFVRTVEAVEGDVVTFDAPMFYRLDASVSQAYVYPREMGGVVEEVGVEDLRIEIETRSPQDETQAKSAIEVTLVENAWVTGVTARQFWFAGVDVQNSRYVTVRDCRAIDPHSQIAGARRYNFTASRSQMVLFEGNYANEGRHAYAGNGSTLDSGIVFLDNTSEDAYAPSEAHRQWGMGFLFDNHTEIGSTGTSVFTRRIHLGNRGSYGSSHGWSCANCVVWNAQMNGALTVVEKPPTAQNYAIGVQGTVSDDGPFFQNTGPYIEGTEVPGLSPRSLYLRQVDDRLSPVSAEDQPVFRGALGPPAPNPVASRMTLRLDLATASAVRLAVFDVLGREVQVVADRPFGAGTHRIEVDASGLAPGAYFVRLEAGRQVDTRPFTVAR
ncbi:MAG: T9SS type A sorting domain-containing protein [Bacteroidota bacterium]